MKNEKRKIGISNILDAFSFPDVGKEDVEVMPVDKDIEKEHEEEKILQELKQILHTIEEHDTLNEMENILKKCKRLDITIKKVEKITNRLERFAERYATPLSEDDWDTLRYMNAKIINTAKRIKEEECNINAILVTINELNSEIDEEDNMRVSHSTLEGKRIFLINQQRDLIDLLINKVISELLRGQIMELMELVMWLYPRFITMKGLSEKREEKAREELEVMRNGVGWYWDTKK